MGIEDAIAEEETDSAKEEVDKDRLMMATATFGKKTKVHEEPSAEGGASMPDQTDKTTPYDVGIVAKSATMKRTVERRRVSRRLQADNSPIMSPTLNTTTMVDCS